MSERGAFWMGRPVDEMSREELLEIVYHLGRELDDLRGRSIKMHDFYRELIAQARKR
jgi:hypothetical protein